MDYTKLPRSVIYKDRKTIAEFKVGNDGALNTALFQIINDYLIECQQIADQKDICKIMNDAYYLCTLFAMDDEVDKHWRQYIEIVTNDNPFYSHFASNTGQLLCCTIYSLLRNSFLISEKLSKISFILKIDISGIVQSFFSNHKLWPVIDKCTSIDFKPARLTPAKLRKLNWTNITNDYMYFSVQATIEGLGTSDKDKRLLIESIYKAAIESDVPLQQDFYDLMRNKYVYYGGRKMDLFEVKPDTKECLLQDDYRKTIENLKKEKFSLLDRLNEEQKRNKELKQRIGILELDLHHIRHQNWKINKSQEEISSREAELNKQLCEMTNAVDTLKEKLGNKTVRLSVIVDTIKEKAELVSLEYAFQFFEQIDNMLREERAWRNNKSELKDFFRNFRKQNIVNTYIDKVENLTQISNVGTYNEFVQRQENTIAPPQIEGKEQKIIE